jgi:hypothetical protein
LKFAQAGAQVPSSIRSVTRDSPNLGARVMTIYHVLASASTGTMLAFAAVIVMVVAAVVWFSMIAYALDTQDNETAREVLRLGARALGELEAARADILRLAAKVDASEKSDSLIVQ